MRHNGIKVAYTVKVEYAGQRKIRERNTLHYRLAHWPIWIWVFFLAPGPLTFNLFARGGSRANLLWLLLVMAATGVAGCYGQLPGVEPRPYILRFTEDKRNPIYRRVCYTFAWNAVINFALLNLAGLIVAAATGKWLLHQIYLRAYFPLGAVILLLGIAGLLPRVRSSTKGEGIERRYFYGAVWTVVIAQSLLLLLWKTLPETQTTAAVKLAAFVFCLVLVGTASALGKLPRTRPIVPGALLVAD
jgi:cation transport ATPase